MNAPTTPTPTTSAERDPRLAAGVSFVMAMEREL